MYDVDRKRRRKKKGAQFDWNDDLSEWRTVLKFRHHEFSDPTADIAIYNVECELLGLTIIEDKYPAIFAAARQERYENAQLVQERAALKRQAHLTHI